MTSRHSKLSALLAIRADTTGDRWIPCSKDLNKLLNKGIIAGDLERHDANVIPL